MKLQPRWLYIFNSISTTNLRVYVTLLVFIATAIFYFTTRVEPSETWCFLLAGMSGMDTIHFFSKRKTFGNGNGGEKYAVEEKKENIESGRSEEESTASTDIQELQKNKG